MKEIKHGFLGKWNTYKKVGFKEVPPTTEERAQAIREKLQPWIYDPEKIKVKYGFVGGEELPPVETYYLQTAQGDNLQTAQGDNLLWTT